MATASYKRYIALVILGIILAVTAGEIIIRIVDISPADASTSVGIVTQQQEDQFSQNFFQRNHSFVYHGRAGAKKEFEVHGMTNSLGFFDEEHSFQKNPNVYRIVVTGDSFVEGLQVPLENHFYKIIEKTLNDHYPHLHFEVIGLGRSGNGPRQNLQFLQDPGMKYDPDLVISEFLPGNDVRNDSPALTVMVRRQLQALNTISLSYRPPLFQPECTFVKNSKLFQLLGQSILNIQFKMKRKELPPATQVPVDYFVYAAEYDWQWQRAWKDTFDFIKKAKELAQSHHSDYLLVNFGDRFKISKQQIDSFLKSNPAMHQYVWDFDHPEKMIRGFCQKENIRLLDLEPFFQEQFAATNQPIYFDYDNHWNETGHRLAAEKILEYLQNEHLITNAKPR